MTTRLNLLPDPAFLKLRPELTKRLTRIGAELEAEQFRALLDPLMLDVLHRGVAEAGAQEGTLWLADEAGEFLVPAYNTGPHAEKFVGQFKQPLNAGLICMVFCSEQPFLENDASKNPNQSKLLDALLKVETTALIAVPFYLFHACRGILSCVQLSRTDGSAAVPAGFHAKDLAGIQRTSGLLSQLIEYQLLSNAIGWSCR